VVLPRKGLVSAFRKCVCRRSYQGEAVEARAGGGTPVKSLQKLTQGPTQDGFSRMRLSKKKPGVAVLQRLPAMSRVVLEPRAAKRRETSEDASRRPQRGRRRRRCLLSSGGGSTPRFGLIAR
jgi:hypothetical protein